MWIVVVVVVVIVVVDLDALEWWWGLMVETSGSSEWIMIEG